MNPRRLMRRLFDRFRNGPRETWRRDVDDEVDTHLAQLVERLIRLGKPPDEARRMAAEQFGSRERLYAIANERERRKAWRTIGADFRDDCRTAARAFRRSPGVVLVAVAIIALGVGLNISVFSVVEATLLRPLPYRDANRLVVVWRTARGAPTLATASFDSFRDAQRWASVPAFDEVAYATWARGPAVFRPEHGAARWVTAIPASVNFFDLFGVRPALGRAFIDSDLASGCTAIISHAFWSNALGADRAALGRTISIGGAPCAVVGVMPAGFEIYPRNTDLWTLISPASDSALRRRPDQYLVGVFARLRRGTSPALAQRELRQIAADAPASTTLERDYLPTIFDLRTELTWLAGRNLRVTLVVLWAAVSVVLLATCANVASLLLSRAERRAQEFAIRAAIGASRRRLVRQLLAEATVIATFGALGSAIVATVVVRQVNSLDFIQLPAGIHVALNWRVAFALVACTALVAVLISVAPAMRASAALPADALRTSGRGIVARGGRLARNILTFEVASSVLLAVAAGMLLDTLRDVRGESLGYSAEDLITVDISFLADSSAGARDVGELTVERAKSVSGVASAALTDILPVRGSGARFSVTTGQGNGARAIGASVALITGDYFHTMGVPLRQGRSFNAGDDRSREPVAIVNQAFARTYLSGGDALGRRFRLGEDSLAVWLTVVGVVGDEERSAVAKEIGWVASPMVFRPLAQVSTPPRLSLVARLRAPAPAALIRIERGIRSAAPGLIVSDAHSMTELIDAELQPARTRAKVFSLFAFVTLTLATIGLYSLLSQFVTRRARDLGVRLALGASPSEIGALVVRRAASVLLPGCAFGVALSFPVGRALRAVLYNSAGVDVRALVFSVLLFVAITTASTLPLARRAATLDPLAILRDE